MKQKQHIISSNQNLKCALEKINSFDSTSPLILFVVDNKNKIIGSLTDGDIRRALLAGRTLSDDVTKIMNKKFRCISDLKDYAKLKEYKELDLKIVPLVAKDFRLIEFIDLSNLKAVVPVDAIIMAGGKGVRLKPYTNDRPKPMLELAGKPIIAHNIDKLLSFGIKNIYISVNHMKESIIDYVKENYRDNNIKFIEENQPLGTIGSIRLVNKYEGNDILIMNADVLTNIDLYDFFASYKRNNDNMSIATFNVRINIPYAVLNTKKNTITSFTEKPSYVYYSNAGIYLINKNTLKYIPKNQPFDSTDLMEKLLEQKKKVSHFPIRGYWLDIGNAQNYAKAQDDIKYIKF